MSDIITAEQLTAIDKRVPFPVLLAGHLSFLSDAHGIRSKISFAAFLANCLVESGGLRQRVENLNYRAETILRTWPKRFKHLTDTIPYAHNPEALANKVYGKRNGNNQPGDGWKFRGRGFIQLTGRGTYAAYQKSLGFDDLDKLLHLIEAEDYYTVDSACWFFGRFKNLVPLAEKGNFKEVCRRINGGYTAFDERLAFYNKIVNLLQ